MPLAHFLPLRQMLSRKFRHSASEIIFYDHVRSTSEGNVFIGVCHSVQVIRGEGGRGRSVHHGLLTHSPNLSKLFILETKNLVKLRIRKLAHSYFDQPKFFGCENHDIFCVPASESFFNGRRLLNVV